MADSVLHYRRAALGARAHEDEGDNSIATIEELLRLYPHFFEWLEQVLEEPPELVWKHASKPGRSREGVGVFRRTGRRIRDVNVGFIDYGSQ